MDGKGGYTSAGNRPAPVIDHSMEGIGAGLLQLLEVDAENTFVSGMISSTASPFVGGSFWTPE